MNNPQRFRDRREAGRILAAQLQPICDPGEPVVLGLPRGGVPVACEVARVLKAPLDIVLVRKLGAPAHPEYAMGAIASGGFEVLNQSIIDQLGISSFHVASIADRERNELSRSEARYRADRRPVALEGRTTIVVDDGLATGATMRAALRAARDAGAGRLIAAAPVGSPEACDELRTEADLVFCPLRPDPLYAVSYWYRDFAPTSEAEVCGCLASAALAFEETTTMQRE